MMDKVWKRRERREEWRREEKGREEKGREEKRREEMAQCVLDISCQTDSRHSQRIQFLRVGWLEVITAYSYFDVNIEIVIILHNGILI